MCICLLVQLLLNAVCSVTALHRLYQRLAIDSGRWCSCHLLPAAYQLGGEIVWAWVNVVARAAKHA